MWFLLRFIPTEIISLISFNIFIIGILAQLLIIVLQNFPYKNIIQILSVIFIVFGVYGFSSSDVEKYWRAEAKKTSERIAELEKTSGKITEKIVTVYVDKVKVVKGKSHEIQKQIKTNITEKSDNACKLSNTFVWLHDSAAKNQLSEPSSGIDETASDVKLSTATETITQNYGKYYEISEQLKALQNWVLEQQKNYNQE